MSKQELTSEQKEKELWEIYNVGDYIDAKDNQGDWRVGLIVDKNLFTKHYKIRFDGWESKYNEPYKFGSPKLSHFRSIVIGYTGKKRFPGVRDDWKFNGKIHKEKKIAFEENLRTKDKTAWEINQFYRGHNYIYTDFLMTETYESLDDISEVMNYYFANIKMVIEYLKNIDPEFRKYYRSIEIPEESHLEDSESALANAFYEIMDTLYIISGSYNRLECFFSKNAALLRKFLNVDFEKNVRRYYQLKILEKVMNEDGIKVIEELINDKLATSKCFIPLLFLKSLASLYIGLSNQFTFKEKKEYLDKLIEITKINMLKLNEKNLKNINKDNFTELIETFKSAYENSEDEESIKVWSLEEEVRLYLKMVECPYFDKKLKGVIGFQELIEKIKMQSSSKIFIEILLKEKVFETLFASDNAEIIKKSVEFCKSLCFHEVFPYEVSFKIWELREGKHEAAIKEIYSLISSLPSKFNNQNSFEVKLFEEISKQPKENWDEDYIKMIKDYSISAIGWTVADNESCKYGFDILYENAIVKKTEFATNCFIDLLQRFEKSQVMTNFINECFQKIESNEESYTYVIFLLRIIEESITDFKEASPNASSIVINDLLTNSNDTLERNAKRFELLFNLTKITNTNVTLEEFLSLWNGFKDKLSEKALFDWILIKNEKEKIVLNQRIGTDIRKKIFEEIWGNNNNFEKMTEKESKVFIEFFKNINSLEGKLKRINIIIKVESEPTHLVNFDKIWKAFETVEDDNIAMSLAELIVEVSMCPNRNVEENKEIWTQNLIKECSVKIQAAYSEKNIQKVSRLLMIPTKIIERDEENFKTKQGQHHIMKEYRVYNISTKEEKHIKFNLEGMLFDFKKLVADRFKIPHQKCKLSCKGELIRYENYFTSLYSLSYGNTPFELEIIEEDIPSVKTILNNELELFFILLGDAQLEKLVWEIIERLPMANYFLAKIEESPQPWQEINSTSLYKELYIMKCMSRMSEKWWCIFIAGPGLLTLTNKLNNCLVKTKVEREYLKILCENIAKCLEEGSSLQEIDLENLTIQLFKCLNELLENVKNEEVLKKHAVEIIIISSIFKIFEHLSRYVNVLSVLIQKFEQTESFLEKGLLTVKSSLLKSEFAFKMKSLSSKIKDEEVQIYLSIIFKRIFEIATESEYKNQASQYFSYSSYFVDEIERETFWNFLQKTENEIVNQVERRILIEQGERSEEAINQQLVGLLTLTRKLLPFFTAKQKEMFTEFLLNKCFFPHLKNSNEDLLCKTKESKTAAFELLSSLITESKSSQTLLTLEEFHKDAQWRTKKFEDWTLTPGDKIKSASGYVGIENLACICYMNSFFQQIFMIPDFRQAILECEDPLENKEIPTENVLYQVKKMFFSLINSEKKYYSPNEFCHSFKNYEGQPTNVFEQMDIDEFSGLLFDRLENQMKGTQYENIIKDFFGGVFSNEIICKGCPHFSETEESFLSIGLNVKNKKNIYQSLDSMIKGDTLDGDNAYFCERCNKKVSAVKRVCLKKLPDHLIMTLKRFEFDFETMNKLKLNDYCEFPTEINLKEYSQQYLRKLENPDKFEDEEMLPDSYYDYTLQGIVIHIGHAESGHYYSFIKERKDEGRWFEFNDKIVRPFDIKKVAEEAFGGEMGTIEVKEKIKNAYMLIYERKAKIHNFDSLIDRNKVLTDIPVYKNLISGIQEANTLQKIENVLFSSEYTKFAENLIKNVEKMEEATANEVLKFATLVYLTVTIREKELNQAFEFLKLLNSKLQKNSHVQEWVFQIFVAQKSLKEFFKNNISREVRKLLASWILDISSNVSLEKKKLLIDNLLGYIIEYSENSDEICFIIYGLMNNREVCEYFISKHGAGIILENILGREKGLFKKKDDLQIVESAEEIIGKEVAIEKSSSKKIKFIQETPYAFGVLSKIVDLAESQNVHIQDILKKQEFDLFIFTHEKNYKILEEIKGKFFINKFTSILAHLAKNNQKLTDSLLKIFVSALKNFISKRYRQFFILIKKLFQIQDDLSETRNKNGLISLMNGLKENEKHLLDSSIIQQWIIKIIRKNDRLQELLQKEEQGEVLEYFLNTAGKKVQKEEDIRKNSEFMETTVNKYHGVKLPKSKKSYEQLNKNIEKFFENLAERKENPISNWDSDEDMSEKEIKVGDKLSYFDTKEKLEFVEAEVEDVFLNSLNLNVNNNKIKHIWQDDEKITSDLYPFDDIDSDDDMADSENTTEMEPDEDQGI